MVRYDGEDGEVNGSDTQYLPQNFFFSIGLVKVGDW